jgi:hypothetical protein
MSVSELLLVEFDEENEKKPYNVGPRSKRIGPSLRSE